MNRFDLSSLGKRLCALLLPAAFVLLLASSASGAIHSVSMQAQYKQLDVETLEKGHEFIAVVNVEPEEQTSEKIYGLSLDIFYDPDYLEVVDALPLSKKINPKISEGALLNVNGTEQTFSLSGLVNDQPGFLTVGLARKGAVNGTDVDQGGALVSVHFRAVEATLGAENNATQITFGLSGLRDADNDLINVSNWSEDTFQILKLLVAQLDVNDDESIDLQDLILTLQIIGGQPPSAQVLPEADFSGDKRIGMAEAVGILQVLSGIRPAP